MPIARGVEVYWRGTAQQVCGAGLRRGRVGADLSQRKQPNGAATLGGGDLRQEQLYSRRSTEQSRR